MKHFKHSTRHDLLTSLLAIGVMNAMAGPETGGGAAQLLSFEDLKDLSLDDIMDMPLSEIAESAGFVVPPLGHYHLELAIDFGEQGQGDKAIKVIVAKWTVLETVELVNDEDVPVPVGTVFTQNFSGGGMTNFRTNLGPLVMERGGNDKTTVSESLPMLDGIKVTADIMHRLDKEKVDAKGKKVRYPNVVNIKLLSAG